MQPRLYFSNVPGITLDPDTDEHGSACVVVTGSDYDAVLAAALDVKNAQPVDHCPEVGSVQQHIGNGAWTVTVRSRRPAS
jgi:hypothetical protein